jgi:hypothetical protein
MKRDPINPSKSPFIEGRLLIPPFVGAGGKIGLVLFHVIPAKAGIQRFHDATN